MKTPLILITYGLSLKLCTWEEDGIHKLPLFSEPVLALLFLKKFEEHIGSLIENREPPQIQVCENPKHTLDMLKMLGILAPSITIVYNASPIGEDPHEAISGVAGQFQDVATVINKHYELDEATEIFQSLVDGLLDPSGK